MKGSSLIPLLFTLGLTIWSGSTFFNSMDGDILWKKVASGIAFLVFGSFFVIVALRELKGKKQGKES